MKLRIPIAAIFVPALAAVAPAQEAVLDGERLYGEGSASELSLEPLPENATCAAEAIPRDPLGGPGWNGWGVDLENTRFQPAAAAGLAADDVPKLRLKWAFGFPGVGRAGSQPTVVGGRILVGSRTGLVTALDAESGCIHWIHQAEGGVRTAISVASGPEGAFHAYFGDDTASIYAVDFASGERRWRTVIEKHPDAKITGAPAVFGGRLYVGVSSIESGTAADPSYECCTFRGSVVALDAATGERIWKTYTFAEEPKPTGRNRVGTRSWGPRRGVVGADARPRKQHPLRRHRELLFQSAGSRERRVDRARDGHRRGALGHPEDCRRRMEQGLRSRR